MVENLTESEISTERQLSEEKERYRIAVESSNDLFFTYREKGNTLEIVNSREMDGLWDIKNVKKKILDRYFSREDQKKLLSMLQSHENTIYGQFCCINGNHSQERPLQRQKRMIERS